MEDHLVRNTVQGPDKMNIEIDTVIKITELCCNLLAKRSQREVARINTPEIGVIDFMPI